MILKKSALSLTLSGILLGLPAQAETVPQTAMASENAHVSFDLLNSNSESIFYCYVHKEGNGCPKTLHSHILFPKGSTEVSPSDRVRIEDFVDGALAHSCNILVTGWASVQGAREVNAQISERRSRSVAEAIRNAGLSDDWVHVAFGGATDNFGAPEMNQRVDFVIDACGNSAPILEQPENELIPILALDPDPDVTAASEPSIRVCDAGFSPDGCIDLSTLSIFFEREEDEFGSKYDDLIEPFAKGAVASSCSVSVTGWASMTESPALSEPLSRARADFVANLLIESGVPDNAVDVESGGQTDHFGFVEMNQRVQIRVESCARA